MTEAGALPLRKPSSCTEVLYRATVPRMAASTSCGPVVMTTFFFTGEMSSALYSTRDSFSDGIVRVGLGLRARSARLWGRSGA